MKLVRRADWIVTVALAIMLTCYGCAKEGDLVVARVGYTPITLGELRKSIEKTPQRYRPDDKEGLAKQRAYLDVLIDKTLLVKEAYAHGLDSEPTVVDETADYQLGQLRQNLYYKVIRDKVRVTDEEVEQRYVDQQLGRQVKVQRITVKTQEAAQKALAELKGGKPFEEVARAYSTDPRIELGWFRADTQQPPRAVRDRLFDLEVGEVSEAIPVGDTYEILRITQEEHLELDTIRSELTQAMRQEREDSLWVKLDKELKARRRPTAHEDALAVALKRGETAEEGLPEFTDAEKEMPVYTFKGGQLTLGDYRSLLAREKLRYRPLATDSAAVSEGAERLLFRYYLLPEEARRLGTHKLKSVVRSVQSKKEELMVTALRQREIVDQVAFTKEELQKYYDEHLENYVTSATVQVQRLVAGTEKEASEALAQIKRGADPLKLGGKSQTYKEYERGRNVLAEAAFAAKVGDVVGPIEKEGQYAVFKVLQRTPRKQRPLEEVEAEVTASVRRMLEGKLFDEYLMGLRQKYRPQIQVYEGILKLSMADDAAARPASPAASP